MSINIPTHKNLPFLPIKHNELNWEQNLRYFRMCAHHRQMAVTAAMRDTSDSDPDLQTVDDSLLESYSCYWVPSLSDMTDQGCGDHATDPYPVIRGMEGEARNEGEKETKNCRQEVPESSTKGDASGRRDEEAGKNQLVSRAAELIHKVSVGVKDHERPVETKGHRLRSPCTSTVCSDHGSKDGKKLHRPSNRKPKVNAGPSPCSSEISARFSCATDMDSAKTRVAESELRTTRSRREDDIKLTTRSQSGGTKQTTAKGLPDGSEQLPVKSQQEKQMNQVFARSQKKETKQMNTHVRERVVRQDTAGDRPEAKHLMTKETLNQIRAMITNSRIEGNQNLSAKVSPEKCKDWTAQSHQQRTQNMETKDLEREKRLNASQNISEINRVSQIREEKVRQEVASVQNLVQASVTTRDTTPVRKEEVSEKRHEQVAAREDSPSKKDMSTSLQSSVKKLEGVRTEGNSLKKNQKKENGEDHVVGHNNPAENADSAQSDEDYIFSILMSERFQNETEKDLSPDPGCVESLSPQKAESLAERALIGEWWQHLNKGIIRKKLIFDEQYNEFQRTSTAPVQVLSSSNVSGSTVEEAAGTGGDPQCHHHFLYGGRTALKGFQLGKTTNSDLPPTASLKTFLSELSAHSHRAALTQHDQSDQGSQPESVVSGQPDGVASSKQVKHTFACGQVDKHVFKKSHSATFAEPDKLSSFQVDKVATAVLHGQADKHVFRKPHSGTFAQPDKLSPAQLDKVATAMLVEMALGQQDVGASGQPDDGGVPQQNKVCTASFQADRKASAHRNKTTSQLSDKTFGQRHKIAPSGQPAVGASGQPDDSALSQQNKLSTAFFQAGRKASARRDKTASPPPDETFGHRDEIVSLQADTLTMTQHNETGSERRDRAKEQAEDNVNKCVSFVDQAERTAQPDGSCTNYKMFRLMKAAVPRMTTDRLNPVPSFSKITPCLKKANSGKMASLADLTSPLPADTLSGKHVPMIRALQNNYSGQQSIPNKFKRLRVALICKQAKLVNRKPSSGRSELDTTRTSSNTCRSSKDDIVVITTNKSIPNLCKGDKQAGASNHGRSDRQHTHEGVPFTCHVCSSDYMDNCKMPDASKHDQSDRQRAHKEVHFACHVCGSDCMDNCEKRNCSLIAPERSSNVPTICQPPQATEKQLHCVTKTVHVAPPLKKLSELRSQVNALRHNLQATSTQSSAQTEAMPVETGSGIGGERDSSSKLVTDSFSSPNCLCLDLRGLGISSGSESVSSIAVSSSSYLATSDASNYDSDIDSDAESVQEVGKSFFTKKLKTLCLSKNFISNLHHASRKEIDVKEASSDCSVNQHECLDPLRYSLAKQEDPDESCTLEQKGAENGHSVTEAIHRQSEAGAKHSRSAAETKHRNSAAETKHRSSAAETKHRSSAAEAKCRQSAAETKHGNSATETKHGSSAAETKHGSSDARAEVIQSAAEARQSCQAGLKEAKARLEEHSGNEPEIPRGMDVWREGMIKAWVQEGGYVTICQLPEVLVLEQNTRGQEGVGASRERQLQSAREGQISNSFSKSETVHEAVLQGQRVLTCAANMLDAAEGHPVEACGAGELPFAENKVHLVQECTNLTQLFDDNGDNLIGGSQRRNQECNAGAAENLSATDKTNGASRCDDRKREDDNQDVTPHAGTRLQETDAAARRPRHHSSSVSGARFNGELGSDTIMPGTATEAAAAGHATTFTKSSCFTVNYLKSWSQASSSKLTGLIPQDNSTGSTPQHDSTASAPRHSLTGSRRQQNTSRSAPQNNSTGSSIQQSATGSTLQHRSVGSTLSHKLTGSALWRKVTESVYNHNSAGCDLQDSLGRSIVCDSNGSVLSDNSVLASQQTACPAQQNLPRSAKFTSQNSTARSTPPENSKSNRPASQMSLTSARSLCCREKLTRHTSQENLNQFTPRKRLTGYAPKVNPTSSATRSISVRHTSQGSSAGSAPKKDLNSTSCPGTPLENTLVSVSQQSLTRSAYQQKLTRCAPQHISNRSSCPQLSSGRLKHQQEPKSTSLQNLIGSAVHENLSAPAEQYSTKHTYQQKSNKPSQQHLTRGTLQQSSTQSLQQNLSASSTPRNSFTKIPPIPHSARSNSQYNSVASSPRKVLTRYTPRENSAKLTQQENSVRSTSQENSVRSFKTNLVRSTARENFGNSTPRENSMRPSSMEKLARLTSKEDSVKSTSKENYLQTTSKKNYTGSGPQENSVNSTPRKNFTDSTSQSQTPKGCTGSAPRKNSVITTPRNISSSSSLQQNFSSSSSGSVVRTGSSKEKVLDCKNTFYGTRNPGQPQKKNRQPDERGMSNQVQMSADNLADFSDGRSKAVRKCTSVVMSRRLEELSRPVVRRVKSAGVKSDAEGQSRKHHKQHSKKKMKQQEERDDMSSTPQRCKTGARPTPAPDVSQSHTASYGDHSGQNAQELKSASAGSFTRTLSEVKTSSLADEDKTRSQLQNLPQKGKLKGRRRGKRSSKFVHSSGIEEDGSSTKNLIEHGRRPTGQKNEDESSSVFPNIGCKKRFGKKKKPKWKKMKVKEKPSGNKSLVKMLLSKKIRKKKGNEGELRTLATSGEPETWMSEHVLCDHQNRSAKVSNVMTVPVTNRPAVSRPLSATNSEYYTSAPYTSPRLSARDMLQKDVTFPDDDLECCNGRMDKGMLHGFVQNRDFFPDGVFKAGEFAVTLEHVQGTLATETNAQTPGVDPALELLDEMGSYFQCLVQGKGPGEQASGDRVPKQEAGNGEQAVASEDRVSEQPEEVIEKSLQPEEVTEKGSGYHCGSCDQWGKRKNVADFSEEDVWELFPKASRSDSELFGSLRKRNLDRVFSDREVRRLFPVVSCAAQRPISCSTSSISSSSGATASGSSSYQDIVQDPPSTVLNAFTYKQPVTSVSVRLSHSQKVASGISLTPASSSPLTHHVWCPSFGHIQPRDTLKRLRRSPFLKQRCTMHSARGVTSNSYPGHMWPPDQGDHGSICRPWTLSPRHTFLNDVTSQDTSRYAGPKQRLKKPEMEWASKRGVFLGYNPRVVHEVPMPSTEDSCLVLDKFYAQNKWVWSNQAFIPNTHLSSKANLLRPNSVSDKFCAENKEVWSNYAFLPHHRLLSRANMFRPRSAPQKGRVGPDLFIAGKNIL